MIWLLIIPAVFVFHTIATLWAFIVIMKWKSQDMTPKNASFFQKLVFSTGVILDASYNYNPLGGTLALLQFPRRGEVLFTAHLKRIIKADKPGYRLNVAKVYCYTLDFFDVGHCR